MLSLVLGVAVLVFSIGWLSQRITNMILLWYLQEKNCPLPSDEEMKRGQEWVVSHVVKELFDKRR